VEQSPAVSMADVTSSAVGAGTTATSSAENAGTSTAPPTGGEHDNLCMVDPRPTPDPQTAEVGVLASRMMRSCAYTSVPHGRRTSMPTAAMSTTSRRHRA
jgi:hypothetical protein